MDCTKFWDRFSFKLNCKKYEKKRVTMGGYTYYDKDDLKDCTSFVSSPVRIAKECPNKRENVDSPSPFADIVSSISIVLL